MFGIKVKATVSLNYEIFTEEYRNVTKIHHNYNREYSNIPTIAFESDIHGTGITWNISEVLEYEATPETEFAENF